MWRAVAKIFAIIGGVIGIVGLFDVNLAMNIFVRAFIAACFVFLIFSFSKKK